MYSKLKSFIDFLRYQSYNWRADHQTLKELYAHSTSNVEYPFFRIDGPRLIKLGENSSIGKHAWLACYEHFRGQTFDPEIDIGTDVRIGNYSCVTAIDRVRIGDGCLLSDYVYISDHTHDFDPENLTSLGSRPLLSKGEVAIGPNCFVGMRVTVLPGVSLGRNCVVGSHAVVTKSFPAYSMIGGVPAKLIKTYSFDRKKWEAV